MTKITDKYSHYQEYFKSFLGGWSFEDGDKTLTITNVDEQEMFDASTGKKKTELCLFFKEEELPMVLNVTNAQTIAEVLKTDIMSEWIGKQIIVGQSKVKAFGKEHLAIRVRNKLPQKKAVKKATGEQLDTIQALIDSEKITNIEAMLKYYGVSKMEELSTENAAEIIAKKS